MIKKSLLQIKHLSLHIPAVERWILKDIDYTIYPGDIIIVLGGNGSGKSSLVKAIDGSYRCTKGKISLNEQPIAQLSSAERAKKIITLTQDMHGSLFLGMTVLENCLLAELRHHTVSLKIASQSERTFFTAYLKQFNPKLSHKLDTQVERLSGGEKQSLALALCLFQPPQLLLLDEHTSALDPKTAASIMQHTYSEIQKHKITCLLTTHNLEMALQYGNRLLALKEGSIVLTADHAEKETLTKQDLLERCY
jgi:putative tryptophan/tyrosine transport system ATP-binding protein